MGKILTELKAEIVDMKGDIVDMKGDIAKIKIDVAELKSHHLGDMKGDIAKIKNDVAELKSHHLGNRTGFKLHRYSLANMICIVAQVTPEMLLRSQVNMRIQTVGLVEASRLAVMNAIEPRLARAEPIRR